MIRQFITWVRSVFANMFGADALKKLKIDPAVGKKMQEAIDRWARMFCGEADWLNEQTKSLRLPSSISGELARLTVVELETDISGSARADFLKAQFSTVLKNLRTQCEFGVAEGGLVFKPYLDSGKIAVDFVHAQNFIPTAFNGRGEITGAAFVERIHKGKAYYTRIEHHSAADTGYTVTNRAFYSPLEDSIGVEVELGTVDEWASLEREIGIQTKDGGAINGMLFAYFKMPFANTIDTASPLGVSAYADAVEAIREADEQYSRILWEYEGSELAVDVGVGALQVTGGKFSLPEHKKRLFRSLTVDRPNGEDLYSVFSPAIRDTSLFHGLDELLRRIEFLCHLSYGTLSNPQTVEKTAEEIRASKQRSYSAVRDIQKSLEDALTQLLCAMDVYTSLYKLAPTGAYTASFDWGDGILNDPAERKKMFWQYVTSGKFPFWKYLVDFEGYSEADARAIQSETDTAAGDLYADT